MTDGFNGTEPGRQLVPTTGSGLGEAGLTQAGGIQDEADAEAENPLQIARILAAIRRYKWLVVAVSTVGIAGSIAATRFLTPEYQTSATIYIQTPAGAQGPIQAQQLLGNDSWVQLVRSYAVIDPVVRQLRLYLAHAKGDSTPFARLELANRFQPGAYILKLDAPGRNYSLTTAKGREIESGVVGDSIGRGLGLRWLPPAGSLGSGREIAFSLRPPRAVSEALLAKLQTRLPEKNGVMMGLSLDGTDPDQAAATLNGILNQFVMVADQLKRSKLAKVTNDLRDQIRIADSNMRAAESTLEGYRITTITQPKLEQQFPLSAGLQQTQPTVMSNYFSKRIQLSTLQKDRNAIEEVLRRGLESGAISVDAFHTIGAVNQAPDFVLVLQEVSKTEAELRALRSRYTDEYAGIKSLLEKLGELTTTTVPRYASRLVTQLRSQEVTLAAEIAGDTEELRQIPVRTHTEEKYQRDAQSAVRLSGELSNRFEANRLAQLTATPDISILDSAEVPDRPSSNTAPRIILMGVAASIGLALVLAILLDRIDKRFRYPEQASSGLGLSVLGAVPVINRGHGGLMAPAETAQIIEAFRSIRLNLAHSFADGEPILVTITSPAPGDGKSLVSANLAISFAEAGYQTVLIDGDTRRGELNRAFGGERNPGLLDHLDGTASLESTLRQTSNPGLAFMPCGTRSSRGPELLSSASMLELMRGLKDRYQVVLVDSPPLAAGIDPFVLSTVTSNVAIVLRAGETDRELAKAKLQLMGRLPTRVLGAILNHIDVGVGSYKYYAYEYNDGTDDLPAGDAKGPPPVNVSVG